MTKSSALLEFFELAEAFEPDPSQPVRNSANAINTAHISKAFRFRKRRFMADFSIPPLPLIAPRRSCTQRELADKPIGSHGSFAQRPGNPGGWRRRAYKHTR